jgi:hypothetical protein
LPFSWFGRINNTDGYIYIQIRRSKSIFDSVLFLFFLVGKGWAAMLMAIVIVIVTRAALLAGSDGKLSVLC